MKVKAFKKEYYEVELDEQQCEKVYLSYPATSAQLLKRLESNFIKDIQKADKIYGLRYSAEMWLTEDPQTTDPILHRNATPTEIDFFATIQTMKNILLSKEISK